MSTPVDRILEKLRKLRAHQESAAKIGNEAEAQAFADRVSELLLKHRLTLSDVELAQEEVENPVGQSEWVAPDAWGDRLWSQPVTWSENLAGVIAEANCCKILPAINNNFICFIGKDGDRQVVEYLFITLAATAMRLCAKDLKAARMRAFRGGEEAREGWKDSGGNIAYKFSWYRGFVAAIETRLQETRKRIELEAGDCTALVRASQAVERYMDRFKEYKVRGYKGRGHSSEAFERGFKHGQEASLQANALPAAPERRKDRMLGGTE